MPASSWLVALLAALILAATIASSAAAKTADGEVGTRIVGGSEAADGRYRWMVSLADRSSGSDSERHWCGGTLVAPNWVLTAAHCVEEGEQREPGYWRVVLGETHLNNDDGHQRDVERIIRHPGWDPETLHNDIALMKLKSSAHGLPFIPLAQPGDDGLAAEGEFQTILGWGYLEEDEHVVSPALQQASIDVLPNGSCEKSYFPYDEFDSGKSICAGYEDGGVDSCQADSGGPLIAWDGSQPVQTGVVSAGNGCGRPGNPGIYTRVSEYWSWMRSVIGGRRLDLMYAIDATGSMYDDIDAARTASRVLTAVYGLFFDLRVGIVTFKDFPDFGGDSDDYAARVDAGLSSDKNVFKDALGAIEVYGGGDWPETVYSGVMKAIDQPWRADARRAVVLFGDAPPKDPEPVTGYTQDDVVRAARQASVVPPTARSAAAETAGVSLFTMPIGGDPNTQDSFQELADRTGGRALEISDASDVAGELSSLLGALAAEPVASAGGPYAAVVGQPVTLRGTATDDDGSIVDYAWDATGDGAADAHGQEVVWTFATPGAHQVTLTARDNDGLVAVAVAAVNVAPAAQEKPQPPPQPPVVDDVFDTSRPAGRTLGRIGLLELIRESAKAARSGTYTKTGAVSPATAYCQASAPKCAVSITWTLPIGNGKKAKGRQAGRITFAIEGGHSRRLAFRLPKTLRGLARKQKSLKLRAQVRVAVSGRKAVRRTLAVNVKRR